MKTPKHTLLSLLCAAALGLPAIGTIAHAQEADADAVVAAEAAGQSVTQFAQGYARFAGSQENAESLVAGLRTGGEIVLASPGVDPDSVVETAFVPVTGALGYGEANLSLALAEAQLATMGIVEPTAEQIAWALNGGTLVGTDGELAFDGVLQMRADGMGWGRIAQQLDMNLGEVISARTPAAGRQAARGAVEADIHAASTADTGHGRAALRVGAGGDADLRSSDARLRRVQIDRPVADIGARAGVRADVDVGVRGGLLGRPEAAERPERTERPERPLRGVRPDL
jgi:hypothetical protein